MIKLVNVSKSFNDKSGEVKILDDVNLTFPNNGFVAICGKSGCGKTTLLKMLSGLIRDYQGDILFDEVNVNKLSYFKRRKFYSKNIFYLKYNDNFFKKLKVKSAFDFYLNKKEKEKVNQLVEKFELHDLLKKKIKNLSSGELQKISLCISIAKKANITILDEPICNMDNKSMTGFMDEICELSKQSLVIYVSHFEKDILNKYDIKLRMYEGKFTIEQEKECNNNLENTSNDISNHFSLKRTLLCESVKPIPFYCLFRLIIMMFIVFSFYIARLNSIQIGDIYSQIIDQVSLNVVDVDSSISSDAIKQTKMYIPGGSNSAANPFSYLYTINGNDIVGYGRASDYYFADFKEKLNEKEIIISDYLAYKCEVIIGEKVKLNHLYQLDPNGPGYYNPLYTEYTVKHIYKTNYENEILKELDESKMPDWNKYVFLSDEDISKLEDISLNGFGGVGLDCGTFISSYKDEYANNRWFSDFGLTTLEDDAMYANIQALGKLGLLEVYRNDDHTNHYQITFSFNGKSITKSLRYKKYTTANNIVMVSQNVYNEIVSTLGITKDNALYNMKVNTLDINDSSCNSLFKKIKNFETIKFTNNYIFSQKYSKSLATKANMNSNSYNIYILGTIFMIVSLYEIFKIEFRTYKMLKEKNYNVLSATSTIVFSKIITYVLLIGLTIVLSLYIVELII